jgi:hypothetical protein
VHLSERPHPGDIPVVSDEGKTPGEESAGVCETKSLSHHRAEAVCSDNVSAGEICGAPIGADHSHATDATGLVSVDVRYAHLFFDARTSCSRTAEHYRIENGSTHSEAVLAERVESMVRSKLSVGVFPVRCSHPHAGKVSRAGALDLVQDLHIGENAGRLWAQVLRAGLVTRKPGSVEHEDLDALPSQSMRSRCSGRTSTNDNDLGVQIVTHSLSDGPSDALE